MAVVINEHFIMLCVFSQPFPVYSLLNGVGALSGFRTAMKPVSQAVPGDK